MYMLCNKDGQTSLTLEAHIIFRSLGSAVTHGLDGTGVGCMPSMQQAFYNPFVKEGLSNSFFFHEIHQWLRRATCGT